MEAKKYWNKVKDYNKENLSIFIREHVLTQKIKRIEYKNQKVIADFGCGPGNAFSLFKEFKQVFAVDNSDNMLAFAKNKNSSNIEIIKDNIKTVKLSEKCDIIFAIASIMPLNLPEFYDYFDNILNNLKQEADIYLVLPSMESRILGYHFHIDLMNKEELSEIEILETINNQVKKDDFNPLGYMYSDPCLVQKQWLYDEILYRLSQYDFKNIEILKLEADWDLQIKKPEYNSFPQLWTWLVHISL